MSQAQPSLNDLLLTVREFLGTCGPKLEGEMKYHALVASYLLGICERELREGPGHDAAERQALAAFLKGEGSLADLQTKLCDGIRSGAFDPQWSALLDMLLTQTANNVRVVRPDHLAAMHRGRAS